MSLQPQQDVFTQMRPVMEEMIQVYQRDPHSLSAEALLAYMCFAWEQKIRAPVEQVQQSAQFQQATPAQQQQWMNYLREQIEAERRDRNYSIAVWRHFAQGNTPQERQRRLIDALTLEALAIEQEYVERQRGVPEPIIVDRSQFFKSGAFDEARARLFSLVIHQYDPEGNVVETAWWNISPVINDPSFVYFDRSPISQAEWERAWQSLALDPDVITTLEQTDICSDLWAAFLKPPYPPVQIEAAPRMIAETVTATILGPVAPQIEELSPERVTPPAKRPKTTVAVEEFLQQQEQRDVVTFAQQSQSQPALPPHIPHTALSVPERIEGEPIELERCYICQEACVPEHIQLLLAEDLEQWLRRQDQAGGVRDEQLYIDENHQDPDRLIHLLQARARVSGDNAQQYVQAWLSKGLTNFVSSRTNNAEVMRYFRVRCSNQETPHNMQMCQACLNESIKRPSLKPTGAGGASESAMVRALPVLESESMRNVQLTAPCPLGCPRATITELFPFDPATGTLYGKPVQCGTQECYKPSKWDDDLIGPYWLYLENLCFFRSGFIDSSAVNLFVGIVKGYDTDHSSRAGTDGEVAPFETVEDARFPKRIVVEVIFPAPPKDQYGNDVVRYESVPIQDVYPITILPGMTQGVAERRYNSLQQAVEAAQRTMAELAAAPPTNLERIHADTTLRRLQQMFAEAKASLPQQIEKLTELLEENRRIGGSSLLLKKRGIQPSIRRVSRESACDICCGVLDRPELVRVYSANQDVANQCKIQLEAGGTEFPIAVTEDYVYKKQTPEEKQRTRANVLFTLLGLQFPPQFNPHFKGLIDQHFRDPYQPARPARNPGYILAAVILMGLQGLELMFPYEQSLPEDERMYAFVRNVWDEVFTAVEPSAAWPDRTGAVQWDAFTAFAGGEPSRIAHAWRDYFTRYIWQAPRTADARLVYADRTLYPSEKAEIASRKRKREAITTPTGGGAVTPTTPEFRVPALPVVPAAPALQPRRAAPLERRPSVLPPAAALPTQQPTMTAEQFGIPVIRTTPKPVTTSPFAALAPPAISQQIVATAPPVSVISPFAAAAAPVVSRQPPPPQQQVVPVAAAPPQQQLPPSRRGTLALPAPPVAAVVPSVSPLAVVPTTRAGAIVPSTPSPFAAAAAPLSRTPTMPALMPPAGPTVSAPGEVVLRRPTSRGTLVPPQPPQSPFAAISAAAPPAMTTPAIPSMLALTPQLQSTVPDWYNWSVQLATAVGRPNPQFAEYASQWLQSRLDQVLQSNVQQLQWSQVPAHIQTNIINAFGTELQERGML